MCLFVEFCRFIFEVVVDLFAISMINYLKFYSLFLPSFHNSSNSQENLCHFFNENFLLSFFFFISSDVLAFDSPLIEWHLFVFLLLSFLKLNHLYSNNPQLFALLSLCMFIIFELNTRNVISFLFPVIHYFLIILILLTTKKKKKKEKEKNEKIQWNGGSNKCKSYWIAHVFFSFSFIFLSICFRYFMEKNAICW